MTAHRDELGVVCTHGHLERVCPLCELTAERDALAELVRDMAEHGLRCDMNPTHEVTYMRTPEGERASAFWHDYLRRIDATLRARARAALGEGKS